MRGKNKKRPKNQGVIDNQKQEENPVTDTNILSGTPLNDQEWVVVPSQKFYNEFSMLGFGDDLQPYMKGLIHQGRVTEPVPKSGSEQSSNR